MSWWKKLGKQAKIILIGKCLDIVITWAIPVILAALGIDIVP